MYYRNKTFFVYVLSAENTQKKGTMNRNYLCILNTKIYTLIAIITTYWNIIFNIQI